MIIPSTQSNKFFPVIKEAKGKFCWDDKGKKYLDFYCANMTVVLGHKILKLQHPPSFSGKSYLEDQLSKLLSTYTGTNYFRYFKNGHNAVDCAIRLARQLLSNGKRNQTLKHLFMGYHGTSDAYMSTTDNTNGVIFENDYDWFDQVKPGEKSKFKEVDILVFEARFAEYADKIPEKIRICDTLKNGITALYKKHNYDFILYGKSIANGYPMAILTGKDKLMYRINEIYYSTTFGGENNGLEATIITIRDFERKRDKYFKLYEYAKEVLPNWTSLSAEQIKKFQGKNIFFNGFWQLTTEHTPEDVHTLAVACKEILNHHI